MLAVVVLALPLLTSVACTETQLAGGNAGGDAAPTPDPSPSADEDQADGSADDATVADTDGATSKHDTNHDTFSVTKAKNASPKASPPPPAISVIVPLVPVVPLPPPQLPPPASTQITATVGRPDATVDGQEVIKDCTRCVKRAQEISPQAGFLATQALSVNLGYYKVDPSYGLCDIHFLAGPDVPIADHIGQTSILPQQVAVYCPCNCAWGAIGY
jgi:hypothetical protein